MIQYLAIATCAFAVISCSPAKRQDWVSGGLRNRNFANKGLSNEYVGAESNNLEQLELQPVRKAKTTVGGGIDNDKIGFSSGSGLRSIAQGSADQANTAVQNQDAAGHQAAYVAKNTLAQAANAASATAQAALAGKQIILQGAEQQYRDAQVALQGEKDQLQAAQRAAMSAQLTSQQAQRHVQILQAALNVAQATADGAGQAASETAGELAAQVSMVGAAQQRLDQLAEQLHGLRVDFVATQAAAQKAQLAAQQAQLNAADAAAKAAAASGVQNSPLDNGAAKGGVLPLPPPKLQTASNREVLAPIYLSADYDY